MSTNADIPKSMEIERTDDFAAYYANNATVEASVWDLRVLFGQLDQAANKVYQEFSVNVPWNMAKLLVFHLQVQLAAYEIQHGKIHIPNEILPPPFPPPPGEKKDDATFQKVFEVINKLQAEFVAHNEK